MGNGAGGRLAVDGGLRPRRRKRDGRSWTAAKQKRFFETLADSCNVKMAALAAGVSPSTVYLRREKDATFRIGWEKALAEGYAKLELEMLSRALHGVEKAVTRSGETTVMREYNDRVALALLRMHRETAMIASEGVDDGEYTEACERIAERIERIKERDTAVRDEPSTSSEQPQPRCPEHGGTAAPQDERVSDEEQSHDDMASPSPSPGGGELK